MRRARKQNTPSALQAAQCTQGGCLLPTTNGSETQKARYTEIWTYFRDLAVDTQYYFAGGYGASVGELKLSDFNIEENPGEMLARLSDSQSVVSEWWKWWEK